MTITVAAALPTLQGSTVVVPPPERRPGAWSGAPSAIVDGELIYLAYRLRRPIGAGRGYANVVSVSRDGGASFTPIAMVNRDAFKGESLERPALTRTADGIWRLYVSVATPSSKHWRVDLIEAEDPADLARATPRTVLPGDDSIGVKDPVVVWAGDRWHLWASVHPLESWENADRMTTDYATSRDGVDWEWHGTVLRGRPGAWDARGVRVSHVSVVDGEHLIATYDGRATAAENWEEATGVAYGRLESTGRFGELEAMDGEPLRSPYAAGGLRYVSAVTLDGGANRVFYEFTRPDGAHELRTELLPAP